MTPCPGGGGGGGGRGGARALLVCRLRQPHVVPQPTGGARAHVSEQELVPTWVEATGAGRGQHRVESLICGDAAALAHVQGHERATGAAQRAKAVVRQAARRRRDPVRCVDVGFVRHRHEGASVWLVVRRHVAAVPGDRARAELLEEVAQVVRASVVLDRVVHSRRALCWPSFMVA